LVTGNPRFHVAFLDGRFVALLLESSTVSLQAARRYDWLPANYEPDTSRPSNTHSRGGAKNRPCGSAVNSAIISGQQAANKYDWTRTMRGCVLSPPSLNQCPSTGVFCHNAGTCFATTIGPSVAPQLVHRLLN
jgi:hypothetical protein